MAGLSGAALANVLYCAPTATVVEIVAHAHGGGIWVRNICAVVGCRWIPFFCQGGEQGLDLKTAFDVRVDLLVQAIRQAIALTAVR